MLQIIFSIGIGFIFLIFTVFYGVFSLPISIFLLVLNCFFLIFFKKWLGPLGLFYTSIIVFSVTILNNVILIYFNLNSGSFIFLDLGRWFFSIDILSSNLIMCFDNLALLLSIIVLILSIIAQVFGIEYMAREIFISRLIYLLKLFSTSVLFLFIVYDFFLILIAC